MLGVFRRDVTKLDPLAPPPVLPDQNYPPALEGGHLKILFSDKYKQPVIVNLGNYGFIAYSADTNISQGPKFHMRDGIYCIYQGGTETRKKGKLMKNEVDTLISHYRDLKREGYENPFKAMEVNFGDYNVILYDSSAGMDGAARGAFATNCWDDMDVYHGLDKLGFCVITDDLNIINKVCGDSYTSIPKGNGLPIPVLTEIRTEPTVATPSGGSSSVVDASKGEETDAKSLDSSSSMEKDGGETIEASPSDESTIKGSGEKRNAATSSSGGSSSKKARE